MRSSSRNSRETLRALGLAAAASLLLGSAAQAGEHNFVMAAYTDGRGGMALVSGDYAAAGGPLAAEPRDPWCARVQNRFSDRFRPIHFFDRMRGTTEAAGRTALPVQLAPCLVADCGLG